ncbi:MAG: hypothetical protein QOG54_2072 [Actinomycetota bacterium]|jgi:hypothetical protein|nr:hypothetical protein [Actinomycetota bacterium]
MSEDRSYALQVFVSIVVAILIVFLVVNTVSKRVGPGDDTRRGRSGSDNSGHGSD